jgi:hypothetical protein
MKKIVKSARLYNATTIHQHHTSFSKIRLISSGVTLSTFCDSLEITIISTLLRVIFYSIVSFSASRDSFFASSRPIFCMITYLPCRIYRLESTGCPTQLRQCPSPCIRSSSQMGQSGKCRALSHLLQQSAALLHKGETWASSWRKDLPLQSSKQGRKWSA